MLRARYTPARRGGFPPCDVRAPLPGSRPSSRSLCSRSRHRCCRPPRPRRRARWCSASTRSRRRSIPHASPSAVTYQIIASVTENLVYKGPDGKLVALAGRVVDDVEGRAQRDVQAAARREVPRRHAVQRRRGEVQLRPHRRSEVQGRRRPRRARRLRRLEGPRRVHRAGQLRDAVRAVPHLRGVRHAQHRLAQGRARDAATRCTRSRSAPGSS